MNIADYISAFPGATDDDLISAGFAPQAVQAFRTGYMPPPSGDPSKIQPTVIPANTFGDVASQYGNEYISGGMDLAFNPNVSSYDALPQSMQGGFMEPFNREVMSILDLPLGLLSAAGGLGQKAIALGAEAIGSGTQSEERLARDWIGGVEGSGFAPEGRMLAAIADAGGIGAAGRKIAERANQPGPVPTMYSNPIGRAPVTFADAERAMQEAPLAEVPRITPKDLLGARIIPTVADLTAAGRDYTGIDASKLDVPEGLFGGPGYPLLRSSQEANLAWAVDAKSIGTKKSGKGADLIAISAMNPDSHKSNTSVVNSIIKTTGAYVRDGRIQPTVLDELDAAIRQSAASGDPALAKLERFPGFRSQNIDEFIRGSGFEARSRIADIIGSKTFQGKGAPNVNRILQETAEKKYAGANPRDVLFFIEPDFSAPPVDLAEAGLPIHPSYRYGIRGRIFGALDQNISTFEAFPTYWGEKNIKSFGPEFNNGGRRGFDLTLPIEEVTGKHVSDLERLLTYEAAKQVDLSAIDTRILVNSMTDRWKPTTTSVNKGGASPQAFVDAIQNNKYRPALTNYTPKEVKAGAKSGDLVAYQLGDDDVFFAIDKKPDYSWAGVEMQPNDKALVGVVSNAPGSKGTAAPSVIAKALDEGATILDAFAVPSKRFPDGYLPEYYGEFGFDEVGRVPFDKEMYVADHGEQAFEDLLDAWRSDGWDENMGMPPVIVMRWSGTDADRTATAAGIRGAGAPSYRAESGGTFFEAEGSARRVPDETIQQGAGSGGRGTSGSAGTDNRASLSGRARKGAESLLGLTPQQLRNKGIPEDQIQQLMQLRDMGQ